MFEPPAVIVALPLETAVTGTATLVAPAGTTTDAATEATPGLLEVSVTVNPPAGAAPDKVNVAFCVAVPVIVRVFGLNAAVTFTWTLLFAGV